MSNHKKVVTDVIDHFYARLPNPLASDAERRRIALLALDQMEPEDTGTPLEGATVSEVQTLVGEGVVTPGDALAYEQAHGERTTLIAWLEERI